MTLRWGPAVALSIGLLGCGDALVGATCIAGYDEVDGGCVPSASVGGNDAGGSGDGGEADGSGGTAGGAGHPGGGTGTGGIGGEGGEGGEGGAHGGAGAGGIGGVGGTGGVGGSGGDPCGALALCGGVCVDTDSDPNHCGGCFNACITGICQGGSCIGAVAGQTVTIGMDFDEVTIGGPSATLLGNAALLPLADPVRIGSYRQFTPSSRMTAVHTIINNEAQSRGRQVQFTLMANANEVPAALTSGQLDLLLIHHQPSAPNGTLAPIGDSWKAAIEDFTDQGGVVIALLSTDGAGSTGDLVTTAGILEVNGVTNVTGQTVHNVGWLSAVGQGVLSPFLAKETTVTITTPEVPSSALSYVIMTGSGEPVAIHKVVP